MDAHCTLSEWIFYLEHLHKKPMDLGLDRVSEVQVALNLQPCFPIITVGGTNGKGSVCAILSTLLAEAGYKVGTYTSPHMLCYNERILVNLLPITDQAIVENFFAVEVARQATTLTVFEFLTLAAIRHFVNEQVDIAVLEVGLGGRLDAVNLFDANVSIVTNIDLDHCDWLGNTREAIGYEKAGIFRPMCPAIIGDNHPPASLLDYIKKIGAVPCVVGRDFLIKSHQTTWDLHINKTVYRNPKLTHLKATYQMDNAALALVALDKLNQQFSISEKEIRQALQKVIWPWRLQCFRDHSKIVFDVAHNPHAVGQLVKELILLPKAHRQLAVFSMLSDKDIKMVIQIAKCYFDAWFIAGLPVERGLSSESIKAYFKAQDVSHVYSFDQIETAWLAAKFSATVYDRIVVFGSFYTIAAIEKARTKGSVCRS
jgi:dihydrofolate synthase/folylpolyglutamate synthase